MKFSRLHACLLGAALCSPTLAAADDHKWYISPMVNYVFADSDRNADDNIGFQLAIGKPISESWNFEFSAELDTLERETGNNEFRQRGLGFNGLYFFQRNETFSPYGLLNLGMMRNKFADDSHTNVMASVGAGVMATVHDSGTALRLEARHRLDMDDKSLDSEDNFNDWVVSLGVNIPFGSAGERKPADSDNDGVIDANDQCPNSPAGDVDAQGCPVVAVSVSDSDNDGVTDADDQCPNTTAGAKVDAKGCELDSDRDGIADNKDQCPNTAAGAKVDSMGCERDGDKDGIADSQDRCPNTPAGAKVDAKGCEQDSDGDSIVDSKDRCPNTAAGAKVDNRGCELAEVIVLKGVTFASNSDQLIGDSTTILNDVAKTLIRNNTLKVEVAGFTDNTGAVSYNQQLSQRRADAVRNYLINKGVPSANLQAKGYGPASPIADNATAQGRAANRRVELHILNQ